MPIIINNVKFSEKPTKKILIKMREQVGKLPGLKVTELENSQANTDNTVICSQREIAHLKTRLAPHKIFMGTKKNKNCMFFIVYNGSGTDFVTSHVDHKLAEDEDNFKQFASILQSFDDNKDIQVSIVGGIQSRKDSQNNLDNILCLLYQLSETLKIDITIQSHMINERNVSGKQNNYECIYNGIMQRLDILSREFFNKPLRTDFINQIKVSDLINRNRDDSSLAFTWFSILTINAVEVYIRRETHFMKEGRQKAKIALKETIENENKFYEMAAQLFSREGFNHFAASMKSIDSGFPESNFINFVFDIKSHNISVIKESHPTPNEVTRDAKLIDFYALKPSRYFLCYDKDTDRVPTLSEKFIQFSASLEADVKAGVTNKQTDQLLPADSVSVTKDNSEFRNALFRFTKQQMEAKAQQSICASGSASNTTENTHTLTASTSITTTQLPESIQNSGAQQSIQNHKDEEKSPANLSVFLGVFSSSHKKSIRNEEIRVKLFTLYKLDESKKNDDEELKKELEKGLRRAGVPTKPTSHADQIPFFLELGVDIDAKSDSEGKTALHIAVEKGNIDFAQALLRKGAKHNIPDKNGLTAYEYAIKLNNTDILNSFPKPQ